MLLPFFRSARSAAIVRLFYSRIELALPGRLRCYDNDFDLSEFCRNASFFLLPIATGWQPRHNVKIADFVFFNIRRETSFKTHSLVIFVVWLCAIFKVTLRMFTVHEAIVRHLRSLTSADAEGLALKPITLSAELSLLRSQTARRFFQGETSSSLIYNLLGFCMFLSLTIIIKILDITLFITLLIVS